MWRNIFPISYFNEYCRIKRSYFIHQKLRISSVVIFLSLDFCLKDVYNKFLSILQPIFNYYFILFLEYWPLIRIRNYFSTKPAYFGSTQLPSINLGLYKTVTFSFFHVTLAWRFFNKINNKLKYSEIGRVVVENKRQPSPLFWLSWAFTSFFWWNILQSLFNMFSTTWKNIPFD